MTDHDHKQVVPGCYRCDLGKDEERESMLDELDAARAEIERLREDSNATAMDLVDERDDARADLREAIRLLGEAWSEGAGDASWSRKTFALLAKHKEATDG